MLAADGQNAHGARAGGGSGGSIHIATKAFKGLGLISVIGGSVPLTGTECFGGGGSGGRVAIHFESDTYTGELYANGGASSLECGGAGTVIYHDTDDSNYKLVVDNKDTCTPLSGNTAMVYV